MCAVAIPPLAVGRAGIDDWIVKNAIVSNRGVVDITPASTVYHQIHSYSHVGGASQAWAGGDALANRAMAGDLTVLTDINRAPFQVGGPTYCFLAGVPQAPVQLTPPLAPTCARWSSLETLLLCVATLVQLLFATSTMRAFSPSSTPAATDHALLSRCCCLASLQQACVCSDTDGGCVPRCPSRCCL